MIGSWARAKVGPTPPARPSIAALLGSLALAVGLSGTGCASGPERAASLDGRTRSPSAKPTWPEDEERLLHLATETLIARCMAEEGFEYVVVPMGAQPEVRPRPYGFDDLEAARVGGFGLEAPNPAATPNSDAAAPDDPNTRYVRSLPPERARAYSEAMIGPPGGPSGDVELPGGGSIAFGLGGCLGGARDQLYGDVQGFLETSIFIGNLLTPVQERVIEDDEFRSALGAWRRCMAEAGYPGLERSSDATQLARAAWEVDPGTAKEREVEIAVATATCARETELVATGERRESEVWAEVLEEHAGVIAAYEELRGPALDRAQDILEAP